VAAIIGCTNSPHLTTPLSSRRYYRYRRSRRVRTRVGCAFWWRLRNSCCVSCSGFPNSRRIRHPFFIPVTLHVFAIFHSTGTVLLVTPGSRVVAAFTNKRLFVPAVHVLSQLSCCYACIKIVQLNGVVFSLRAPVKIHSSSVPMSTM